ILINMKTISESIPMIFIALALFVSGATSHAAAKIEIDDTKWLSVGAGLRTSFTAVEDAAGTNNDSWSSDFNLDSARIYLNGQIHKYIKFELNTECVFCGNSTLEEFVVLDAIAKFEFSPQFNIWAGRLLVPAERQELNGPYYSTTYDAFKTPFYSSDFSVDFCTGGAGVYARDYGVNLWGAIGPEGALQYVFGAFNGLESAAGTGPNQDDNLLFAGRIAYNFLSVEKNPGYYTSGTYYGNGGDILTLAVAMQHQEDGSGSFLNPGDFFGISFDLLFEKVLSNNAVATLNGEYKNFDSDYSVAAFTDGSGCFCMFDGDSFSIVGLYMFPNVIGVGKFQPYLRYTDINPNRSASRDGFEAGVNYIINGHNARVSMFYQHGDIATKGLNYAPTAAGAEVDAISIAVQLQL
ncbi:MAG: hypothetical protein VYD08_09970, partial [Pseudomonadota bacterium]|nr:hypothetical protein [Pseudomonadota bacterium]